MEKVEPLRQIGEDEEQIPSLSHRYLARRALESHQASPVVRPEQFGCVPEGRAGGRGSDN